MPYLLQVDFPMCRPIWRGDGASLYRSGAQHRPRTRHALENLDGKRPPKRLVACTSSTRAERAQAYLNMHSQRLTQAGVRDIRSRIFAVK